MIVYRRATRYGVIGLFGLISIGLAPTACRPIEAAEKEKIDRFYDLEAFFKEEKARLRQAQASGTKLAVINGEEETLLLDTLPLDDDFAIFINSDINRRAWIDKYQGDTLRSHTGTIEKIDYQSLDSGLKIQRMEIKFEGGQVSQIDIARRMESIIATTEQHLHYVSGKEYEVESKQRSVLGKETKMRIKTTIGQE